MNRLIIDVREPIEFKMGHVKGAINIPPSKLMAGAEKLRDVPKDTELILYCRMGSRSAVSMNILQNMGYTNAINGINKDFVKSKYL
ncbi:MAG TPA: rhodanese-like domain-containing protein [Candidatus Saccharimonadales bacterium]|jgi:rhodanese-related sulfurtransferase|nr:rhodanese-like domain-containing protein [Candidatus Saccharimonadales bacterium]